MQHARSAVTVTPRARARARASRAPRPSARRSASTTRRLRAASVLARSAANRRGAASARGSSAGRAARICSGEAVRVSAHGWQHHDHQQLQWEPLILLAAVLATQQSTFCGQQTDSSMIQLMRTGAASCLQLIYPVGLISQERSQLAPGDYIQLWLRRCSSISISIRQCIITRGCTCRLFIALCCPAALAKVAAAAALTVSAVCHA